MQKNLSNPSSRVVGQGKMNSNLSLLLDRYRKNQDEEVFNEILDLLQPLIHSRVRTRTSEALNRNSHEYREYILAAQERVHKALNYSEGRTLEYPLVFMRSVIDFAIKDTKRENDLFPRQLRSNLNTLDRFTQKFCAQHNGAKPSIEDYTSFFSNEKIKFTPAQLDDYLRGNYDEPLIPFEALMSGNPSDNSGRKLPQRPIGLESRIGLPIEIAFYHELTEAVRYDISNLPKSGSLRSRAERIFYKGQTNAQVAQNDRVSPTAVFNSLKFAYKRGHFSRTRILVDEFTTGLGQKVNTKFNIYSLLVLAHELLYVG